MSERIETGFEEALAQLQAGKLLNVADAAAATAPNVTRPW